MGVYKIFEYQLEKETNFFEYQLEKETDFLLADGDGSQDVLIEHLKKANDELLHTAKYYKGNVISMKKKMDRINTERKREINSVKNFIKPYFLLTVGQL